MNSCVQEAEIPYSEHSLSNDRAKMLYDLRCKQLKPGFINAVGEFLSEEQKLSKKMDKLASFGKAFDKSTAEKTKLKLVEESLKSQKHPGLVQSDQTVYMSKNKLQSYKELVNNMDKKSIHFIGEKVRHSLLSLDQATESSEELRNKKLDLEFVRKSRMCSEIQCFEQTHKIIEARDRALGKVLIEMAIELKMHGHISDEAKQKFKKEIKRIKNDCKKQLKEVEKKSLQDL